MEKGNVRYGDTCVITGAGIMGLLHVKAAKLSGLKAIITEVDEARKAMAKKMGADRVVDPLKENLHDVVMEETGGIGAQAVFYTAGGVKACEEGIKVLAKGGTIVFYGAIYPKGLMGIDPNNVHYDEINITGLISTTKESFRQSAACCPKDWWIFPRSSASRWSWKKSITPSGARYLRIPIASS
jgi:L-iditol 2-dehydrogenase